MRRAVLLLPILLAAPVVSCLTPTEIVIAIDTNACSGLSRVDIYVDGAGADSSSLATSTTAGCVNAKTPRVGTLTILPRSGAGDSRVDIKVVGAVGGGTCAAPSVTSGDTQCIVARRVLSFVPHTRLDLPIYLDSACAGHACNEGQTCTVVQNTATCINATCDADGGACGDGGTTGGCPGPMPDPGFPPTLMWSFDDRADGLVHEDSNAMTQPQLDGYFSADNICGGFFITNSLPQPLAVDAPQLAVPSFEVAFMYSMTTDGTLLEYVPDAGNGGGWRVYMQSGQVTADVCSSTGCLRLANDPVATWDGQWHQFAMTIVASDASVPTVSLYRDDATPFVSVPMAYAPVYGTLEIGAPGTSFDQLAFYALN